MRGVGALARGAAVGVATRVVETDTETDKTVASTNGRANEGMAADAEHERRQITGRCGERRGGRERVFCRAVGALNGGRRRGNQNAREQSQRSGRAI